MERREQIRNGQIFGRLFIACTCKFDTETSGAQNMRSLSSPKVFAKTISLVHVSQ